MIYRKSSFVRRWKLLYQQHVWHIHSTSRRSKSLWKAFQRCLPFFRREFYFSERFHKQNVENFVIRGRLTQKFLCLIFDMETFPLYMNECAEKPLLILDESFYKSLLIQLTGVSGLGKSYLLSLLLFEFFCMLILHWVRIKQYTRKICGIYIYSQLFTSSRNCGFSRRNFQYSENLA